MKIIKAVVFDLDGTLLNRDASLKLFIEKQFHRLSDSLNHIGMEAYRTRFIELENKGYVWKDKVYRQLVDEFSITGLTAEELLDDYVTQFHSSCIPFPNLIGMLENLKDNGIRLGMITNGKGQFQLDNIQTLEIEKYFEVILISEWEGMKKPEPEIFKKALEILDVLPAESIYVGDHPEKDIQAAGRVGMKGIWKRDDYWTDVRADFVVEDLAEIPAIVEKINGQEI